MEQSQPERPGSACLGPGAGCFLERQLILVQILPLNWAASGSEPEVKNRLFALLFLLGCAQLPGLGKASSLLMSETFPCFRSRAGYGKDLGLLDSCRGIARSFGTQGRGAGGGGRILPAPALCNRAAAATATAPAIAVGA